MNPSVHIVHSTLGGYADRGVFQNLQHGGSRKTVDEFHFAWLHDQAFTLTCDARRRRLVLADLLPAVQNDSMMHRELKAFLKSRSDPGLPEHRRIDPERAVLGSRLHGGLLSIELTLRGDDYEYGTRKLVNVGHEVFLFLGEYWAQYLWQAFRLNME